jgi:hypothetical protein
MTYSNPAATQHNVVVWKAAFVAAVCTSSSLTPSHETLAKPPGCAAGGCNATTS